MNKKLVLALAVVFVLLSSGWSQQKALKVLVLYDMEGVSGASSVRHTDFGADPEYSEARKSLTADVNAAIAGLKAAGATEIIVCDGHGSGNSAEPDVFETELLAPAKMIARDRSFDIYMDSYDQSFDAIVAVAMHAGAGNPDGFLSHTYTIEDVQYRVNGTPFNETMIMAMGAARFGIPMIMVSGDDQLDKELKRFLPWVKYAAGKHAVGRTKAEPFAREEVSRRIETAAREALLGLGRGQGAPGFPRALSLRADLPGRRPGPDRSRGSRAPSSWPTGSRSRSGPPISRRATGPACGSFPPPGSSAACRPFRGSSPPSPNAEKLRDAVGEDVTERWLDPKSVPSAAAGSGRHPRPSRRATSAPADRSSRPCRLPGPMGGRDHRMPKTVLR